MSDMVDIVLWSPHRNQRALADDRHRFKLIRCGRRFGKTTYAVNFLVEEALLSDEGLFYYIGPTYKQAKMIAWKMLLEAVRVLPPALVRKINESELYVELNKGARIYIKGADNPDSLRGVGLNGAVLDEYADIRENVFTEIIQPALLDRKGWCVVMGTPKGFNHFYRLEREVEGDFEWGKFHFTSYDNPFIAKEDIDRIRATTPEDIFQQEYMAEFRRFEGLVYKEFDPARHLFTEMPERQIIETIGGLDFGMTNPACLLTIKKDFDNCYWVTSEWYERGHTGPEVVEVAKATRDVQKINAFYPDPENPDIIKQMADAGLTVREVIKGSGSVAAGVDKVKTLFKNGKLFIHKSCKNLIFELETYHYPPKREGYNLSEDPVKENDHAVDALRYPLMMNTPTDVREQNQDFGLYAGSYI
jgi:PBSX family phage terminase large subunit